MTTRPASATRAIGALALLLAASGCVTSTSSAPPDFRFLDGSENGLVLVSFSQWGTKWKYRLVPATGASGSRELLLSGVGGKEPLWIGATVVVPFEVPEGNYEFFAWTELPGPGGWFKSSTKAFSIPFRAVRGKVVYIGRINRYVPIGEGWFELSVSDQRDADLPAFLGTYRHVKADQVLVDVHPSPPPKGASAAPARPPGG